MKTSVKLLVGASWSLATAACGGCGSHPAPRPSPPMTYIPLPPPPTPMAPPQARPCDQAQLLATTTALQARAAIEAPGMKADGIPICGVAAEGQSVVSPVFAIEQGYCYTFLGQSLPPVVQMDLQLDSAVPEGMALPPGLGGMLERPLLVSVTPGERVTMGEKRQCFTWPFFPLPGTAKLLVRARLGSGPVAAQIFKKKL